ncbi:hypothetical protein [Mitsuaria sp. WAJ17]|uniref:hypothetical protein n=1 Tax=Mitsuaria sp. WAJ17 TaxID=2761452 RepID=UPI001C8194A7|nr:hypothetical protein [Mitsuaria sp. WAJ17]
MLLLDNDYSERQLSESLELDLRNIGSKVWHKVLSNCRASNLRLYHITLSALDGIESLTATRTLELEWATKIETLLPVFAMRRLESLSIYDFPKLRELDGIEELSELKELKLSGSRGALTPKLRLQSIAPVCKIQNLTSLALTNLALGDDDVAKIAKCTQLRHLKLSNQFERAQVAYLAKHLNEQLVEPLTSHVVSGIKCKTCDGNLAMFIGRRVPMLCQTCNRKQFTRYVDEFSQLVASA